MEVSVTCKAHVFLAVGRFFRVVEFKHVQNGLRILLLLEFGDVGRLE